MTKLEQLETAQSETEGAHQWSAALVAALGNPAEWSYTGECIDAGEGVTQGINPPRCACNHPIRFCFIITHPTKGQTQVGSECINYFQDAGAIHIQLTQALETIEQQIAQAKAAAKKAEQDAKARAAVEQYRAAYTEALNRYEDYRNRGERAPRQLWEIIASNRWAVPNYPPQYTRASDIVRWCTKHTEIIQKAVRA